PPAISTLSLHDALPIFTRDFGARIVAQPASPRQHGQDTVMSLLMRNAHVTTRYSGGFVQTIAGLAGGSEGGQPVDWFYYVNGVEDRKSTRLNSSHRTIS